MHIAWWLKDVFSEIMSSLQQVLESAGERFDWEESWGFGRSKYFLHGPSNLLLLCLLIFPHWMRCRLLHGKAWEEEGEHGKGLWKSVYLVSCCSGTRPGSLNLLNHKPNVFPTCKPIVPQPLFCWGFHGIPCKNKLQTQISSVTV